MSGKASSAGVLVCACVIAAGCGKKGPPLPPLARVPDAVSTIAAHRAGGEVYVTLRIPAQNIDGSRPADLVTVDLLALTADKPPSRAGFLAHATAVATLPVAPPVPRDTPPPATPPPGSAQGADVTIRDAPSGDALVPVILGAGETLAPAGVRLPVPVAGESKSTPAAAPTDQTSATPVAPRRYYMAIARGPGRRSSPSGAMASVSWQSPPNPPPVVTIAYTQDKLTVAWEPVSGAAAYNVYRETTADSATTAAAAPPPSGPVARPVPANTAPLESRSYQEGVKFGEPVCFRVSALLLDSGGELLESTPAAPACERPRDTFAPASPTNVSAVAVTGEITLSWSANAEADLAGYVVLRGNAGDDTLLPITASPVAGTRYVDASVMPGVRYVYAVIAVDSAAPVPNRSEPSARDDATAR